MILLDSSVHLGPDKLNVRKCKHFQECHVCAGAKLCFGTIQYKKGERMEKCIIVKLA